MKKDTPSQPIHSTGENQSPPVPSLVDNPSGPEPQRVTNQTQTQRISKLEDRITRADKRMIFFTASIAFFALCQLFVGVLQYVYGGKQTDKLITAADKQAVAAESFSRTADRVDVKIGQAENDFQRMADSSKKSIQVTQGAMRLDQRAWVGLKYIHMDAPEAEKVVVVNVALANSGKTLANKVVGYSILALSESKTLLKFPEGPKEETESVGIFWPGLEFVVYAGGTAETNLHNFSLTKDGVEKINNGKLFLFVYGTYTYEDVFGASHTTEFCARYSATSKHFEACPNHNNAT